MHTRFGHQMEARKSYNTKQKGKKSYQPILTFLAKTKEYVTRELRNGDRPTAKASLLTNLEYYQAALIPQTG